MHTELTTKLQEMGDHDLAKNLAAEETLPPLSAIQNDLDKLKEDQRETIKSVIKEEQESSKQDILKRVGTNEEQINRLWAESDNQQQYGRLEILELLEVPYQDKGLKQEDTTEVAIDFFRRFMNLDVRWHDISVTHRTYVRSDERKMGSDYVDPIYVKFLNRSLVNKKILLRRHSCLRRVK